MDLTDNQESKRAMSGLIGLQLHAGKPMKVQFKDIYLKEFAATTQDSGATSKPAAAAAPAGPGLGLLFTALLMVAGVAAFTCTTKQSHA